MYEIICGSLILIFVMGLLFDGFDLFFGDTDPISKEEYDKNKTVERLGEVYDPLMGDRRPKE